MIIFSSGGGGIVGPILRIGAHAISLAERRDRTLAVMFFDLDRFKSINDTHGHTAGDSVSSIGIAVHPDDGATGEQLSAAKIPSPASGGLEFYLAYRNISGKGLDVDPARAEPALWLVGMAAGRRSVQTVR